MIDRSEDKAAMWQQRPFDAIFKGDDWQGTPKGYRLERRMGEARGQGRVLPLHTAHVELDAPLLPERARRMTSPESPAVTAVVPTHNRPDMMRLASEIDLTSA